jgi:hypothetical protein
LDIQAAPSVLGTALSLASVLVGWLLHEFSDFFKLQREDRRAVGRVLAELLEVRTRLLAIPRTVEEIRKKVPIAPHDEIMFRQALDSLLPGVEQLQKRYNETIDGMAGRLPLLAFSLRSKDIATPLLSQLRILVSTDPQAVAILGKVEDRLVKFILPQFDELALKLAKLHGWTTWWRTRSVIARSNEPVKEIEDFLSEVISEAQESAAKQPQSPESSSGAK